MKRIIQAVVVAALFIGTQAKADDPGLMLPSEWTYADRHAAEIGQGASVDAFPGSVRDDGITVPSMSTYADGRATAPGALGDAFPGSVDEDGVTVPSMSTYTDRFITEPSRQASAAADPALSQ